MAKKKQRKKVFKPPQPKLATLFNCPECGRQKIIEVRMLRKDKKGHLQCRACGVEFETKLKSATTPIDIYYEWIDYREKEQEKEIEGKEEIEEEENENEEKNDEENIEEKENDDDEEAKVKDDEDEYEYE